MAFGMYLGTGSGVLLSHRLGPVHIRADGPEPLKHAVCRWWILYDEKHVMVSLPFFGGGMTERVTHQSLHPAAYVQRNQKRILYHPQSWTTPQASSVDLWPDSIKPRAEGPGDLGCQSQAVVRRPLQLTQHGLFMQWSSCRIRLANETALMP